MQQLQYDIRPGEFADAVGTTRSARTFFSLLLGLAILYQIAVFALVEFGGVLDSEMPAAPAKAVKAADATPPPPPAPAAVRTGTATTKKASAEAPPKAAVPVRTGTKAATRPSATTRPAGATTRAAASPATAPAAPGSPAPAAAIATAKKATPPPPQGPWQTALQWSLPITKFLALATAVLVMIAIGMAVMLSLIGRLGGMAELIGAFFWSTILLAMVVPWQQVPGTSLACGALYNFAELTARRAAWSGAGASWQESVFYYGRFLAYPLAALCVWLIVQIKFGRGCSQMHYPHMAAPVSAPAGIAAPPAASSAKGAPAETSRSAIPAAPARSLAQRAMDDKPQAAPAAPAAETPAPLRPTGPLTERFLGPRAEPKPQEPERKEE